VNFKFIAVFAVVSHNIEFSGFHGHRTSSAVGLVGLISRVSRVRVRIRVRFKFQWCIPCPVPDV